MALMATSSSPNPSQKKQSVYLQNMEEVEKVFNSSDANGDRKISVSKLGAVLESLRSTFSNHDEPRNIMNELDSNNDGLISLLKFVAFCHAGGASELRKAFGFYDKDNNGQISASELHCMLSRLDMKCSIEDCHRMIRSVDSIINIEEFKQMMTNDNENSNGFISLPEFAAFSSGFIRLF